MNIPRITAVATDINHEGLIVGYEFAPDGSVGSPLAWRSGLATSAQLLPLPEIPSDASSEESHWEIVSSNASSISDDGLIAGNLFRRRASEELEEIEEENYLLIWKVGIDQDGELIVLGSAAVYVGSVWPD